MRRTREELAATAPETGRAGIATRLVLRVRPGELVLEAEVAGIDELQRRTSRMILWLALGLFFVQGIAFTLLFPAPTRVWAVGMAAALAVFFVVLWLVLGPRAFRAFERRIAASLDNLLHQAAVAGEDGGT